MQPTLDLTTPFIDPANTARATSVGQMFLVATSTQLQPVYELGIPTTWISQGAIRNNTMSHDLSMTISVPDFMSLDIPSEFIISRDDTIYFQFTLNETKAKEKGRSVIHHYQDNFLFTAFPLNVSGPVYVRTNLAPISFDPVVGG